MGPLHVYTMKKYYSRRKALFRPK